MASTRPSILSIDSGTESWDTEVDDNFDKIVGKPFPGVYAADPVTLAALYPPLQYAACQALVWDGIDGSTPAFYISNGLSWVAPSATLPAGVLSTTAEIRLTETQLSGVSAGVSVAGAWSTRLNTLEFSNVSGASFAAGVLTIPAGTYKLVGKALAGAPDNAITQHQLRLMDRTLDAPLVVGLSNYGKAAFNNYSLQTADITGKFTVSGVTDVALEHFTSAAVSLGTAASSGEVEVYSTLDMYKVG